MLHLVLDYARPIRRQWLIVTVFTSSSAKHIILKVFKSKQVDTNSNNSNLLVLEIYTLKIHFKLEMYGVPFYYLFIIYGYP